ncbi:MAG: adenylyltransferase/cytidyltransferase family protein [Lactobacillaceae bacterium]|jgi:pantetheine-phosphate adenylyltransferase|nr:adenylyltransferase/cytidyltransferase family protein [Lactobacillaceae bacterium]
MKKIGFYAGSFDPFTVGHLAIVCKALGSYDEVIVGVGVNPAKRGMFNIEERAKLARQTIDDLVEGCDNRHINGRTFLDYEVAAIEKIKKNPDIIKTTSYDDLTIDCAIRNNATALIRGERHAGDTVEETQLENMNNALAEVRGVDIKTDRIMVPKTDLAYVSSSACKGLCDCGEYIAAQKFVAPAVHHELMKKYLYGEFQQIGKHFKLDDGEIDIHFNKLVKHYSQNRSHHNLSHIAYGLNQINIYKKSGRKIPNIIALKTAMFFHDTINTGDKFDEERSAKMAAAFMHKADKKDLNIVRKCIMATKHTDNKTTEDMSLEEKIIADIDLAVLGDNRNFGTYSQNIRKEYSHFDDGKYAAGRTAVLNKFLSKDKIFQTDYFARFERKAKDNLKKERGHWLGVTQDMQSKKSRHAEKGGIGQ